VNIPTKAKMSAMMATAPISAHQRSGHPDDPLRASPSLGVGSDTAADVLSVATVTGFLVFF
jgi:hypothetical protein